MNARMMVGSVVFAVASAASANLITNGSFEGAGLPGWSNWGGSSSPMNVYNNSGANGFSHPSDFGNFTGVTAQDGDQFVAALLGSSINGYISQTLAAPLVVGETYRVSGWLHQAVRNDLDHPSGYQIIVSNDVNFGTFIKIGSFAPTVSVQEGWVLRSFEFEATPEIAALQYLTFFGEIAPGQGNSYAGLDNVALEAVPEPVSMIVLSAGVIVALRRRRLGR